MASAPSRAHRFLRSALLTPSWRGELRERPADDRVVTRAEWGAAEPRRRYTWRGPLTAVVLHHTQHPAAGLAGRAEEARYMQDLQRAHFDSEFDDIGYHFVVAPSGRIFVGRPATALGAHVSGHNTGTVGVAIAGDYDLEQPSAEAIEALAYVRERLIPGGTEVPLTSHGQLAPRKCPGAFLLASLPELAGDDTLGSDAMAEIDFRHFQPLWRRHSDAVNARLLRRWLPASAGASLKTDLFDEAVGDGLVGMLSAVAPRTVGIDYSAATVGAARERHPGIEAAVADVRELPLADREFDLAVSLSTLDHLPTMGELRRALAEIHRVLKPGGTLVLTLDNRANPAVALRNALPFGPLHRLGVLPYPLGVACGPRTLRDAVERTGFAVTERTAIMHAPRVLAVAAGAAIEGRVGAAGRRRYLRSLMAFELLERLPTRLLSGYFVALRATRL